jgi:DNA polymerase
MNPTYLVLDYETRSRADIKKVGGYEYANHDSTRILCASWRVGSKKDLRRQMELKHPAAKWSPALSPAYGEPVSEMTDAMLDPSVKLVAHNAFFEQVITRFVLAARYPVPKGLDRLDPSRWLCTASLLRALAFPGKLAEGGAALGLPIQKDMEGHRLMLKMSKPRKPTKNNPAEWHNKKSDLYRLMEYCATDVDAETLVLLTVPHLSANERRLWELDQRINWRGFKADRPLVKKILGMIATEAARFERETAEVTGGAVRSTAQRDATLKFLASEGVHLPDLTKKTVEDAISSGLAGSGRAGTLLRIRQAASKTSTAKYEAFEARSRTDGRVRDNLVYHAASTGRWGGSGVQPHNFPRPTMANAVQAAEIVSDPETDLDLIRLLYGNPLDVFSNVLRPVIIPSAGREILAGDFAGIEVRKLFWIAKHEEGLNAYRQGRDLYCEQAAEIYAREITKENAFERQLGKKVILGAGFGLGKDKFRESCIADGIEVSEELAARAIAAYRSTHWPVKKLWSNLEKAAVAAVLNPGKKYTINRTSWWLEKLPTMKAPILWCQLPSGRRLCYYGPEIRHKATPWGEKKPTLYHWDIHPKTKKWVFAGTYGGKLTENVVQASARDVMAEAMARVEAAGYEILFTVHDEIVTEREKGKSTLAEFESLMARNPAWASDLPIKVEGFIGSRYQK